MKEKKFKFLAIFISYGFFIFLIILSVNAVVPERDLLVLEQNGKLIEKVDNKFLRNQNSVYEILEEDESSSNEEKLSQNTESTEKMSILTDNGKNFFHIQLASFKSKEKSLEASKKINEKFLKNSFKMVLTIRKVNVRANQMFFRVISQKQYSYSEATSKCKKLKEIQIDCILIKG